MAPFEGRQSALNCPVTKSLYFISPEDAYWGCILPRRLTSPQIRTLQPQGGAWTLVSRHRGLQTGTSSVSQEYSHPRSTLTYRPGSERPSSQDSSVCNAACRDTGPAINWLKTPRMHPGAHLRPQVDPAGMGDGILANGCGEGCN